MTDAGAGLVSWVAPASVLVKVGRTWDVGCLAVGCCDGSGGWGALTGSPITKQLSFLPPLATIRSPNQPTGANLPRPPTVSSFKASWRTNHRCPRHCRGQRQDGCGWLGWLLRTLAHQLDDKDAQIPSTLEASYNNIQRGYSSNSRLKIFAAELQDRLFNLLFSTALRQGCSGLSSHSSSPSTSRY